MIKFIIALLAVFSLMTSTALASDTGSQLFKDACSQAPSSSVCVDASSSSAKTNPVNHLIHVAANVVALITGAVALVMIIISGFKFVSGGGSPESVKSARATLVAAVIGLVIIALSWTIINFAVDKLIKN